jgi:hypothetical protein
MLGELNDARGGLGHGVPQNGIESSATSAAAFTGGFAPLVLGA